MRVKDVNKVPLTSAADTDTLILPVHFPSPTVGLVTSDGDRFHYRYKRG